MKRQEAIERICTLITDVGSDVFNNQLEHDCICGFVNSNHIVINEQIILFIENAVKNAIVDYLDKH